MDFGYFYTEKTRGQDLLWSMLLDNNKVYMFTKALSAYESGESYYETKKIVIEFIKVKKCDAALSWNFFPVVSEACEELGIPYLAWIFDSPLLHIYSKKALNSCNYVFSLDKKETETLRELGINAYHLPMGVNSSRLNALEITDEQIANYSRDVAFVGSLYQSDKYKTLTNLPAATRDKLEMLFRKQIGDWCHNYLYDEFTKEDGEIFAEHIPISHLEDYPLISSKYLYCGLIVARKMAELERQIVLNHLAEQHKVTLYNSADDHSVLYNVECRPAVDYESEAPIVYFATKINLNLTLKSIETGIPLRAFDVMGVGGFLLSNYQEEFEEFYVPDKEVVLFKSMEELDDKVRFYLSHERERVTIAMNGYKRTCAEHTMLNRVRTMIEKLR